MARFAIVRGHELERPEEDKIITFGLDKVRAVWAELGLKTVRMLRRMIMVEVLPFESKTAGGLWLPPKQAGFYGGFAHQRILRGMVLSAGKDCIVQEGDVLCFARLFFARWKELEGGRKIGWVDENDVLGWAEDLE
jgi:hypothetical protein